MGVKYKNETFYIYKHKKCLPHIKQMSHYATTHILNKNSHFDPENKQKRKSYMR